MHTPVQVSDDTLRQIFSTILTWHLEHNRFPAAIRALCPAIISATLDVYSRSMKQLLPTPTKSHYTFNLRDLARVVQVRATASCWCSFLNVQMVYTAAELCTYAQPAA
jgi:hypothetical protein